MPPNSVMYRNKEKIEKKNRRIDIAQKKKTIPYIKYTAR